MKKVAFYLLLIILWELVYKIGVEWLKVWKPYIFPSPLDVLKGFSYTLKDSAFYVALATSLSRLIFGFLMALIVGLLVGVVIVKSKFLGENLKPLMLGIQTLPNVCWIPFSILFFGLTESAIYFMIFIGSIFSVAIGTESAVSNINTTYIKAARIMGARGFSLYKEVVIPAALPTLVSAIKQGWSFGWRALIAAEMMFGTKGIGHVLTVGRDIGDITVVIGVMISITFIGVIFDNCLFGALEKKIKIVYGY